MDYSKPPKKNSKKSSGVKKQNTKENSTIFLPTLLPDPFGESSPELCWEMKEGLLKVIIRLTQFGWNASIYFIENAKHYKGDTLTELRDEVISDINLAQELIEPLSLRWVLAYETA